MKYLSVCSGIEAATVAWHDLGWEAVAYSEIEPFPSAVLAHHYPDVPNVGDMTKFKEWNLGSIELLVGGTPCQSFSVAGLRKGLEDPRGNLALTYCGILDKFRPKWFVWENVPGVLSSNGGRDFGSFLGALAELGYGFAYRVLDAQYFGVAQRRRRVFVVGYLGDWRPAAEVLFEPESLRRDTPPSREQGQEVAGTIAARFGISRNNHEECVVSYDMKQHHFPQHSNTVQLTTKNCATVRGDTPLVQSYSLQGAGATSKTANGSGWNEEVSFTLNSTDVHGVAQPIAYSFDSLSSNSMKSKNPDSGCNQVDVSKTLDTSRGLDPSCNQGGIAVAQPIAYNIAPGKGELKDDIHVTNAYATKTLDASGSNPAMHQGGTAVMQPMFVDTYNATITGDVSATMTADMASPTHTGPKVMQSIVAPTLTASNDPSRSPQSTEVTNQIAAVHAASMAVRRLTPVECERLQGFPDNYTNIPWRKAVESPDGPRYKALGNSMAVPVMAWIGRRIEEYEQQANRS